MTGSPTLVEFRRELARLRGSSSPEKPRGAGLVTVVAQTAHIPPAEVGQNAEAVLRALDAQVLEAWPTADQWAAILPGAFVRSCAAEQTPEENERWLAHWRSLSATEQARLEREQAWTLTDWLYWMKPDNRIWFWWDAENEGRVLRVRAQIQDWPTPLGALYWLLRASGASDAAAENA